MNTLLQLLLLVMQVVQSLLSRAEREEHDARVAEIKADPRAAFVRKFGRVRDDVSCKADGACVPEANAEPDDGHEQRRATD